MRNLVSKTLLPAAGISISAALPCAAQGAIVPSPEAPVQAIKNFQIIRLRFVPANVMAHWLDPKNHPIFPDGHRKKLRKPLPFT